MTSFLFELKEGLLISLRAIRANKVRSVLTTIGIIIGVWAVVVMSTAIKGIDGAFEEGISSLGSDNLYIDKWAWFTDDEWWKLRNRKNINLEQVEKFRSMVKLPLAVAPNVWSRQRVKKDDRVIESVMLTGSDDEYLATTNFTFDDGRFYSGIESKSSRNVAVLGSNVAEHLFPMGRAIDQDIKIGDVKYKVVGVLNKQGSTMMGDMNPDEQIYVPLGTIFKNFQGQRRRTITIIVRAQSTAMVEETKAEAEGIMRKVRGLKYNEEDDFSINQQESLTEQYNQTVGVIQIAGLLVTGLSLFVGAIGIMNIMFVSVRERTKEIGIRKAIGAKNRSILGQFISEAVVICLIGGFIGLILAVITALIMNQFFPTKVQYDAVVIAFVISLITGVLSGFTPAYTAAKMDPVEALRFE